MRAGQRKLYRAHNSAQLTLDDHISSLGLLSDLLALLVGQVERKGPLARSLVPVGAGEGVAVANEAVQLVLLRDGAEVLEDLGAGGVKAGPVGLLKRGGSVSALRALGAPERAKAHVGLERETVAVSGCRRNNKSVSAALEGRKWGWRETNECRLQGREQQQISSGAV